MTIVPGDAFTVRLDLDPITFEAMGNDQNYREVVRDQHGETEFGFNYFLWAHAGDYNNAETYARYRSVMPAIATKGRLKASPGGEVTGSTDQSSRSSSLAPHPSPLPSIVVDPKRAIATCLKPADGPEPNGVILRLQETAGKSGPLEITVEGYSKAWLTDLLERDLKPLAITGGMVTLDLKPNGLAAVRLIR